MSRVSIGTLRELLQERRGVALEDVIGELALAPDEALFWSGSWLDGFANASSDIDLYVLGGPGRRDGVGESTAGGMTNMYMTVTPGRTRLDVTVIPLQLVQETSAFLRSFSVELDYPPAWSDNYREFVHRFRIGLPVANEDVFQRLRSTLDFDKFDGYLVSLYHNRSDSLLDDIVGLQREGDLVSALLLARRRLEVVIDMYLVRHGESNTRVDKWRWKKLQRVESAAAVREDYLRCAGLEDTGQDGLPVRLRHCLKVTNDLLLSIT